MIDPISALSTPPPAAATGARAQAEDIKQEFLTLLIAQIEQQDPLNPQDPAEFTAQLTQFSSLEQLINISETMESQIELQAVSLGTAAASFIGKNAEVQGDSFTHEAASETKVSYSLSRTAHAVTVNVYDQNDNLVRSVDLGSKGDGAHEFVWDGKTSGGVDAASGKYRFEVNATDTEGEEIEAKTSVYGRITGVRFDEGVAYLNIEGNEFTMSQLRSIAE